MTRAGRWQGLASPGRRAAIGGLAGAALALPAATLQAAPSGELLAALRAGRCAVLVRHAQTEPGIGDPPGFRLDVCKTQRNLSDEGRAQARRLGALLREAGVPLGPVRSSRWCRCQDTARLAFGRVEPWPVLDSFFADRSGADSQTEALRAWLKGFEGPGNAMLITHQVNVTAFTGEWVAPAEALVLGGLDGVPKLLGRFSV
jgi:broad specificity phosphatase PhoE